MAKGLRTLCSLVMKHTNFLQKQDLRVTTVVGDGDRLTINDERPVGPGAANISAEVGQ